MDDFGRKTWLVRFIGQCEILAESEEEAKSMFWQMIDTEQPLPSNWYFVTEVKEWKE